MSGRLKYDPIFTPKRLNTLGKSLLENFGRTGKTNRLKRKEKHPRRSFNRCDIVNEKACDDIIQYLAPTLEQHKGCTLIDVHPGACLFSSKLHDYLKPKWHILMEPEEGYVEPYIKPLLDKPGSTYRHTYLHGAHPSQYWDSYEEMHQNPSLLPTRPRLAPGDPKLKEFDPSLLVIGNLLRSYKTQRIDMSFLVFHQMSTGVLGNDLFQRSGLVRQLWWIPEKLKHFFMPRSTFIRSAFSTNVEMGIEPREVAGVVSINELQDATTFGRKRAGIYNRLGMEQVAKRMEKSGMSPPKGRELLGVDYDKDISISTSSHKSPFEGRAGTVAEVEAGIQRARERLEAISKTGDRLRKPRKDSPIWGLLENLEYPQAEAIVDRYAEKVMTSRRRTPLVLDIALRIISLEASYKDLEDQDTDPETLDRLKTAILKLDDDLLAISATFSQHTTQAIQDLNEEQIAFYMSPQHTPFERRPWEPLKLSGEDFFPPTSDMALLDCMPKPRDLGVPDLGIDNKEAAKVCAEMIRHLFSARLRNVVDALNSFAVNAGNDLVPMVPAIHDVRRGGRLDPRKVQVRMLTDEMIEGLVKAFFEWPFRPQTWQLTNAGSGVDREAAERSDVGAEGEEEGLEAAVAEA